MVAGAFPIAKLGALAIRQLSKPLANRIKSRAKASPFFRTYICMPPAQLYHWIEVNVKMRLLNLGKPSEVTKLNENMAIELGAELLGESIIFGTAVITLVAEYIRSSLKEKEKEAAKEERFRQMEETVQELRFTLIHQEAEIRHLTQVAHRKPLLYQLISSKDEDCDPDCNLKDSKKLSSHAKEAAAAVKQKEELPQEGKVQQAIQDATHIVVGKS